MRIDNWTLKLAEVVQAAQSKPFEWGTWDCCQFAGEVAAALTGTDPRSQFPTYSNEAEAERIIADIGGFAAMLTRAFGEPKHPAFSQRGDIVLCDFGRGPQPAVCLGVWCVAPGALGLEKRMTDSAFAAWSI